MPPTPNMGLTLPTVGVTLGPEWATELNAALNVVDAHNHTTGNGVPIPSAGIGINADLSFNSFNGTGFRSVRMVNQSVPLAGVTDLTCLYVSGNNLYYNNGVGNQVQITQGAGLDASTVGGFGGDYGTSTASAFYTSATSTFTFWQAPNQSAIMDMGPLVLHPTTTVAFGITLKAPDTLSNSFQLTLPGAAPSSSPQVLQFDTSGNGAFSKVMLNLLAAEVLAFLVPTGTIISSGATATPAGYLYCDGTAYLNADYPALYSAVGGAYGMPDGTHFNVPDLRGLFVRGQADGSGQDPNAASRTVLQAGGNSGDAVGSFQADQVGPHAHSITDPGHAHNYRFGPTVGGTAAIQVQNNGSGVTGNPGGILLSPTGISVDNTGTTETRSKNVYVRYYIKT